MPPLEFLEMSDSDDSAMKDHGNSDLEFDHPGSGDESDSEIQGLPWIMAKRIKVIVFPLARRD